MSREKFSDHCEGCRPAIVDYTNNRILLPDNPAMIAINKWWTTRTTYKQREIWHAVTCLNSRVPSHLRIAGEIADKISAILKEHPPT